MNLKCIYKFYTYALHLSNGINKVASKMNWGQMDVTNKII